MEVSRRDLLKGGAVLAAGAAVSAGMGLYGCSNEKAKEAEAQSESLIPETWDQENDIVVVGAAAGMAAALAAYEYGAEDIVIIEAEDHVGGLWMTAGGGLTMGGGNHLQQAEGEKDDVESWYEEEMYSTEYRANPELIRMLCENGVETMQWLTDLGMDWTPLDSGALRKGVKRGTRPAEKPGVYEGGFGTTPNAGICYTSLWHKHLIEKDVPILLNHKMTSIYREPNGPVVGIQVETSDGIKNFKANKAVILCTGTFTDNDQFCQAWDPRAVGENCYGDGGIPSANKLFINSDGLGHIAAAEIGAGFSDMSFVSFLFIFYGSRSYWGWGEEPIDWSTNDSYAGGKGIERSNEFFENVIIVQNEGKRYFNEELGFDIDKCFDGRRGLAENPETPYTKTYLELPQPRNVWAVADSAMAATLEWDIDDINNPNPWTGRMFDPECVAVADTIEELAQKMGVDPKSFTETVTNYNEYVESGVDEEFGKVGLPAKIETPPFYGLKASLVRHTQRNGLRINTKCQVIDQGPALRNATLRSIDEEPVIPHLYAAGQVGDFVGYRRPHSTLGHYTTTARVAAKNAANEA